MSASRFRSLAFLFAATLLSLTCSSDADTNAKPAADAPPNNMARALAGGGAVFVIRPMELTAEQGAWTARVKGADYVFTSLEQPPWDMPGLTAYLQGMKQTAAASPDSAVTTPVLLRIPPLHELGMDSARARVQQALQAGVSGIIFPHILSKEEMAQTLELLGPNGWPNNPRGDVVGVQMIEDKSSIAMARELMATPGVKVILLGPMSLHSSYEQDSVAVEAAIQSVLSICKETDIACGITAGAADVVKRVQQGFRFLVVREAEVMEAGKAAAGRSN